MLHTLKILLLVITLSTVLAAQNSARGSLEGAWRVSEIVATGAWTASTSPNPQPGLFIFTRTHYSFMRVSTNESRTLFQSAGPTNDEKVMAFDSFAGTSGTYEVSGSTLTVRPVVARSPNCMGGAFLRYQFQIEGNTLSLTQKSTDVNCLIGQQALPSAAGSEMRWKLTRVE